MALLLPMDVQMTRIDPATRSSVPPSGAPKPAAPREAAIAVAAKLLQQSRKPLILAGQGAHAAGARDALIALASEPRAIGEVYNIGNTHEISIRDLADRVKAATGSQSPIQYIPYDQAYEAGFEDMPRRVPDISKLGKLIGYAPKVQLDEIIKRVVDHARER